MSGDSDKLSQVPGSPPTQNAGKVWTQPADHGRKCGGGSTPLTGTKSWPSEYPINDPRNTCGAY